MPIPARRLIDDLGKVVDDTLQHLVASEECCALIEFPEHANVGDSAIWLGERMFLARQGVRVTYACSIRTYSEHQLRARIRGGPILISGGGNLGDLWPHEQGLREAVIRAFPRSRIIQLPQSIWFSDSRNLARARAVFDSHPDLTILVRDRDSLEFAQNEFRATSLLCPDMAFALGPLPRPLAPDRDVVCLLRQDIESMGHSASTMIDAVPVDWLADQRSFRIRLHGYLALLYDSFPHLSDGCSPLLVPLLRRLWDGVAGERIRRGCAILSRGRVVVTDRLHGHILSLLLGIPHVILDNTYGKLGRFYETWTRTSDLTHWAKTPNEAAALARDLVARR